MGFHKTSFTKQIYTIGAMVANDSAASTSIAMSVDLIGGSNVPCSMTEWVTSSTIGEFKLLYGTVNFGSEDAARLGSVKITTPSGDTCHVALVRIYEGDVNPTNYIVPTRGTAAAGENTNLTIRPQGYYKTSASYTTVQATITSDWKAVSGDKPPVNGDVLFYVNANSGKGAGYEYGNGNWSSVSNLFSGSMIVDGSISVDKINVTELYAQDVTVTGSLAIFGSNSTVLVGSRSGVTTNPFTIKKGGLYGDDKFYVTQDGNVFFDGELGGNVIKGPSAFSPELWDLIVPKVQGSSGGTDTFPESTIDIILDNTEYHVADLTIDKANTELVNISFTVKGSHGGAIDEYAIPPQYDVVFRTASGTLITTKSVTGYGNGQMGSYGSGINASVEFTHDAGVTDLSSFTYKVYIKKTDSSSAVLDPDVSVSITQKQVVESTLIGYTTQEADLRFAQVGQPNEWTGIQTFNATGAGSDGNAGRKGLMFGDGGHSIYKWSNTDDFWVGKASLTDSYLIGMSNGKASVYEGGAVQKTLANLTDAQNFSARQNIRLTTGNDQWLFSVTSNNQDNWSGFWTTNNNVGLILRDNANNIGMHLRSDTTSYMNNGLLVKGNLAFEAETPSFTIKDSNHASGNSHTGWISFRDKDNSERAWVGYGSSGDTRFSMVNHDGNVRLYGQGGELSVDNNWVTSNKPINVTATAGSKFYGLEVSRSINGTGSPDIWGDANGLILGATSSSSDIAIKSTTVEFNKTTLINKSQNNGVNFGASQLRLAPSSTTDNTGTTSIGLGISVLNNYGFSLNAHRTNNIGSTGKFSLNWHNNSSGGVELLAIDNDGKLSLENHFALVMNETVSHYNGGDNYIHVLNPQGAQYSSPNSTTTGALKIILPQLWTNTMLTFWVDVFIYATSKTVSFLVSGYNHTGSGGTWVNVSAHQVGGTESYNVRFGHNGTKAIVWIGETATNWAYCKVTVRNLVCGFSGTTRDQWATGWDITTATAFDTVNHTKNANYQHTNSYRPDGSASTPAHTFYNDTDTGFYRKGTNVIGVTCGNDNQLSFAAGSYGIDMHSSIDMNNYQINYTGQVHFNSGVYLKNDSSSYVEIRSSAATTGIKFRDGSDNFYGYIYGDSSGANFGILNKDGQWAFRSTATTSYVYYDGNEKLRSDANGIVAIGRIYINDGNTYINEGSGNSVRVQTNYGNLEIGPQNTSHCHLQTDRSNFYFNKEIRVDSGYIGSYNEDLYLRRAQVNKLQFSTTQAIFTDQVKAPTYREGNTLLSDKYLMLTDLAVSGGDESRKQSFVVAVMDQFEKDKNAGLFDNYSSVEGSAAIGFLNAAFGQFNVLASDSQITNYIKAAAIDVDDLFAQTITASGSITGADFATGSSGRRAVLKDGTLDFYSSNNDKMAIGVTRGSLVNPYGTFNSTKMEFETTQNASSLFRFRTDNSSDAMHFDIQNFVYFDSGGDGLVEETKLISTGDIKVVPDGGQITLEGNTTANLDGVESSDLVGVISRQTGYFDANGWATILETTSSRSHGEVYISDGESGDHSFMHLEWYHSYADAGFTVLSTGGHAQRLTAVRWLYQSSDKTYGTWKLQVYSQTGSNYTVDHLRGNLAASYNQTVTFTSNPYTDGTPSGYAVHVDVTGMAYTGGAIGAKSVHATTFYGSLNGNASTATWADQVDVNTATGNANYNVLMHSGDTVYQPNGKLLINPSTGYLTINGAMYSHTHYLNGDIIFRKGSSRQHIRFDGSDNSTAQAYIYKDPDTDGIKVTGTHLDVTEGLRQDGHAILNGSDTWIRTKDNTGIYFSSHGGGVYMTDSTWVKLYNSKKFKVDSTATDAIRSVGGMAIETARLRTAITNLSSNNTAIDYGSHNLGTTSNHVSVGHVAARHSQGYRTHVDWGLYKNAATGSGWANQDTGFYIGVGNNDSYCTTKFTFTADGSLRSSTNHIRVRSDYGYIQIGALNSSWAHIDTDRAAFYFYKKVHGAGGFQLGTDQSIQFDGGTTYSMRESTGEFGTVAVYGRKGGYSGYSMEGRAVLMHNGSNYTGLYDDVNNHWHWLCNNNSWVQIMFDGNVKLQTSSTGITVTGTGVATDWSATSDIRVKFGLEELSNCREKSRLINPKTFYRKDGDSERYGGTIAQEWLKVLPESVRMVDDSEGQSKLKDKLVVQPQAQIALLLGAVKELDKADLEKDNKIAKLEDELESMKKLINKLVKKVA